MSTYYSYSLNGLKEALSSSVSNPLLAARVNSTQVGRTEVDLSDVFANKHEEISAPLFTRVSLASTKPLKSANPRHAFTTSAESHPLPTAPAVHAARESL